MKDNEALVLKAVRPFVDTRTEEAERFIDDEYLFKGPGTYEPRIEEEIKQRIEAIIVLPNHALLLKAVKDTVDSLGEPRKAGSSVRILIYVNHFSGSTETKDILCPLQRSRC